jgi:hypothetical protein
MFPLSASSQPNYNRFLQPRALYFQPDARCTFTPAYTYGRTLGIVRLGTRSINLELVQEGWAWWYRKYAPKNKELAAPEAAARKAGRGLWADPKPIPPWDWRQRQREKEKQIWSDVDTGYWLNTSTGSRHNRNRGVW